MQRLHLVCFPLVALALLLAPGRASAESPPLCPKDTGKKKLRVYAIGSSTMGTTLAPMLKDALTAEGVSFRKWGKASSGLARPDFHDWPKAIPGVVRKFHPHLFVVSIGTNDGQNLWLETERGDAWLDFGSARWKQVYGERIDAMLEAMAGEDRGRGIVWVGPTALPDKTGAERMKVINDLMKARIEAFDGKIVFVDALKRTATSKGRLIKTFKRPGDAQPQPATGGDGIHLTRAAVRFLLAEPVLGVLDRCLGKTVAKAELE